MHSLVIVLVISPLGLLVRVASWTVCQSDTVAAEDAEQGRTPHYQADVTHTVCHPDLGGAALATRAAPGCP